MTVWADEQSLKDFVHSKPHRQAIKQAYGALQSARFARLEIRAQDAPLTWQQALDALHTNNRTY
jgi:hypothetical protein